ncbi:MAG TPA: hypothetical protein VG897_03755 [Terriglobales bacterium]|nr:hypothetical protein [Terriglobales bacterium]
MEGTVVGYYIRVLAESDGKAPLQEMRTVLGPQFEVLVEDGDEQDWRQLLLKHADGPEIALVERDPVATGELGAEEIAEQMEEVQHFQPKLAAEWLRDYLPRVKVVYAMQLLSGTEVNDGWTAVHRTQAYLWKKFGGILQADNEGFSNRAGQHILWQFEGEQTGELDVAVLDDAGRWVPFTIDMANSEQVEAFRRGEIPKGVAR